MLSPTEPSLLFTILNGKLFWSVYPGVKGEASITGEWDGAKLCRSERQDADWWLLRGFLRGPQWDTRCLNQNTAREKQEDSGERGDRGDLGDQGHWQGGGVRSMGSNTGFWWPARLTFRLFLCCTLYISANTPLKTDLKSVSLILFLYLCALNNLP